MQLLTNSTMMLRGRSVCFTINNPTPLDEEHLAGAPIKYLIYGTERGEAGNLHYQGFAYHKDAKLFNAWKTILGPRSHVEFTKGAFSEAIAYCKKGEQSHNEWKDLKHNGPNWGKNSIIYERGSPPIDQVQKGNKEKDRWAAALDSAKRGKFDEIDPQIQISQCRNLDHIHYRESLKNTHPYVSSKHLWFWGESRTGKTKAARSAFPNAYLKNAGNKWWDGYDNHEVVIMEDFDKAHHYNGYYLKIWADGYSFQAEKKGGHTGLIRPKLIIVTSNYKPTDIWLDEQTIGPLHNRFTIVEFTHEFTPIILWPIPIEGPTATPAPTEEEVWSPPEDQPDYESYHDFGSQSTVPIDEGYELTTEEEQWLTETESSLDDFFN